MTNKTLKDRMVSESLGKTVVFEKGNNISYLRGPKSFSKIPSSVVFTVKEESKVFIILECRYYDIKIPTNEFLFYIFKTSLAEKEKLSKAYQDSLTLDSTIVFEEDNGVEYYHSGRNKKNIPPNIVFRITEVVDGSYILISYGYGVVGVDPQAYGKGSIHVDRAVMLDYTFRKNKKS